MHWTRVTDFLAMGGYGCYVWGAFGVCALAVVLELAGLRSRRRALAADSGGETSAPERPAPAPSGSSAGGGRRSDAGFGGPSQRGAA